MNSHLSPQEDWLPHGEVQLRRFIAFLELQIDTANANTDVLREHLQAARARLNDVRDRERDGKD